MTNDAFAKGFAAMVTDIRHKVLEEGWFGKAVTPRAQSTTIDLTGEQSPAQKLGWDVAGGTERPAVQPGWWRREERTPRSSPIPEHDRDAAAKEPKAPDRGIDL